MTSSIPGVISQRNRMKFHGKFRHSLVVEPALCRNQPRFDHQIDWVSSPSPRDYSDHSTCLEVRWNNYKVRLVLANLRHWQECQEVSLLWINERLRKYKKHEILPVKWFWDKSTSWRLGCGNPGGIPPVNLWNFSENSAKIQCGAHPHKFKCTVSNWVAYCKDSNTGPTKKLLDRSIYNNSLWRHRTQ